ncbi:ABC transporter substrate-binding protein [Alcaligenaceae bacterium CGII-47]|nr:ABC transporter substrate-binding protein [Alcaligenaceae bacterium CGII-47]
MHLKRHLFGITLAAAAVACAHAQPTNNAVGIGVMTDMSGMYADFGGQGSVVAAKMAIEDFGGHVLGKPIKLVSADNQNKPDIAAVKAREWYDLDGITMITDNMNSAAALAVSGVTKEKNRITFVTSSGTTELTNDACNANTVHYSYDNYALSNVVASAILKQGGDTWAFLTVDYAFGKSMEEAATKVVQREGGKVLTSVRHPFGASDFASFVLQAQASKAKIIGIASSGSDVINIIKTAKDFNVGATGQKLAGFLVFINSVHALGLETAQDLYLASGWYWDLNDETRAFAKRFYEETQQMPSMNQAGVYSSIMTYLNAVKAAGTTDAAEVMAKMKETPINDMFAQGGVIRENGLMAHDMYLMQVKKPSESQYPWDYLHLRATVPAEEAYLPLAESTCPLTNKS